MSRGADRAIWWYPRDHAMAATARRRHLMQAQKNPHPSGPTLDQKAIQRAKTNLLSYGLLDYTPAGSGVRDIIDRSWRRCVGQSVPAFEMPAPLYVGAPSEPSELQRAAAPVLARLSEHLGAVDVAMFLSDNHGNIVVRLVNEADKRRKLDNVFAAEGFDFSERSIGTNGLGTVIEERQPILVRGTEHLNEVYAPLACAGTPIFDPFTNRIRGAFALTTDVEDAGPLLYGLAADVGRQIEANLIAMLGADERALIHAYLAANRMKRDPVIVINEVSALANTAGLPYLNSESHAILWSHLQAASLSRGLQRISVPLASGWHDVVIEEVTAELGTDPAYCVRVLPSKAKSADSRDAGRRGRRGIGRHRDDALLVHPLGEIDEQLRAAAAHHECLAVDGEPGTGKLHTAAAVLKECFGVDAPLVLDSCTLHGSDNPSWVDSAIDAISTGQGVILQNVENLDRADVNRVKAVVECSQGHIPLILTTDLEDAPAYIQSLVSQLATTVRLPAVREMSEQIPAIINQILLAMPESVATTRFSSEALQLLMRWSWPGNIADLARTVRLLGRRLPGRVIEAADLPQQIQRAGAKRSLTMIENAERDAIIEALSRNCGNRTKAAKMLGIGRSTLYRKIREHHIPR